MFRSLRPRLRASALLFALAAATCEGAPAGPEPRAGLYWTFVNNTPQTILLTHGPDDGSGCWDVSRLPPAVWLGSGKLAQYYLEHASCINDDVTVELDGGDYDQVRVRLWAGDPQRDLTLPPMTRHIHTATSACSWCRWGPMNLAASAGSVLQDVAFFGIGRFDTLRAITVLNPADPSQPDGSYRKLCNFDFRADGAELDADCQRGPASKVMRSSRLRMERLCAPGATVSSRDGLLVCDAWLDALPAGDYRELCQPTDYDPAGGELRAQCPDAADELRELRLDTFDACAEASPVSYRDGRLVCERAFVPTGSYLSQCTHVRYLDGVLRADCRTFVVFPDRQLDYRALCRPRSTVRFDTNRNELACDTPRSRRAR